MSLLYVVSEKKNPLNPAAAVKYYLMSKIRGKKSHKAVLAAAAKNTTINAKEIDVAVDAWLDALKGMLADGFSVEVEGLGTFSTSIKSEGSENAKDATPAKVKNIALAFRAKPEMYREVSEFKLEKYNPEGTL
jgi:predicted histone-like DNA-binding protein